VTRLTAGLLLTIGVTGALAAGFGRETILPGVSFGLLATAIQLAATRWLEAARGKPFSELVKALGKGMGLRFAGVLVFLGAAVAAPRFYSPLPTALAYLGVLVPLLLSDLRTVR
jgi:hypothetical protein